MLALILVIVVGTVRLIGGKANNVFSETASAIGGSVKYFVYFQRRAFSS
jgi:Flp pilus assembly pilin Flp